MADQVPDASETTPAKTDLRGALSQAREQIAADDAKAGAGDGDDDAAGKGESDVDQGEDTDENDEGVPAPPKAAKPTTKAELEDFMETASAEEIAAIKADPILSKIYNGMNKAFKEKTGKVAETRKALEAREAEIEEERLQSKNARDLFDALRDQPEAVIKALAQRRGMTVAEVKQEIKESNDDELAALFGEDAAEAGPLFAKAVDKRVQALLAPIREQIKNWAVGEQQKSEEAMSKQIADDLQTFDKELKDAEGEGITPEIEKAMDDLAKKLDPGIDPKTGKMVTNAEYIRMLYTIVTAGQPAAKATKRVLERQARNLREREPAELPTNGVGKGTAVKPGMNLREAMAAAREDIRHGR